MHWDLIVIGGGAAGLTASIMAGEIGAKVLLIDKERLGGDCTWHGCVPSKALIASAKRAHEVRHASAFGVNTEKVEVDFAAVMNRVRGVRENIAKGETREALAQHHVEVAFSGARFVSPHEIVTGSGETHSADKFIIATGSRAHAPPIEGLKDAGVLNNESLFELERLPKELIVIGGGPIGCEMGQALARLGSRVTLVQHADRLLEREEKEIGEHLAEVFRREGIDVQTSMSAQKIEREGNFKKVHIKGVGPRENETRVLHASEVLVAVGRRANVEGLGLAAAGVKTHERGISVDKELQTSVSHIYSVGDVNGGAQFTHWAEHEARIATRNALFRGNDDCSDDNMPWVTFCDPEVARVGLRENEAREQYGEVHVHQVSMNKIDRLVCVGESEGFIKVVCDKRDRILGVHAIGAFAGELLPEWVMAIEHKHTLRDIGALVHAYPTLTRANRRVADAAFMKHNVPSMLKTLFGTFKGR